MNKYACINSFVVLSFLILVHGSQVIGMEDKNQTKEKVMQSDFVVSSKLSERLAKKHIGPQKKDVLEAEPQTFEKTIDKLRAFFCSYKLHRGRFAFNDKEVEIYDQNNKRWCRLNDPAFHVFYTWYDDAVGAVCDSDADVQHLISLASKQLSTINEDNQEQYLNLLMSLPKSVSHHIKEEFAWSDDAFEIEPTTVAYDHVEGVKLHKRKLLVAFSDLSLRIYNHDNYTNSLYHFNNNIESSRTIEKYKNLIATGFFEIGLFDIKAQSSELRWKIAFADREVNSIKFIDKKRIAVALGISIEIVATDDGIKLQSINVKSTNVNKEYEFVNDLLVLPNGFFVSCSSNGSLKFWNFDTYLCIETKKTRYRIGGALYTMLLINNKILCGGARVILYDYLNQEEQEILNESRTFKLLGLDESIVAVLSDSAVAIIDIVSKKFLKKIDREHIADITVLDYKKFPGQRRLLTRSYRSNAITLYDFPTFAKVLAARIAKNRSVEK